MSKPFALIVEDEEMLATIFEKALTMAGFRTDVVRDGALAVQKLGEIVPDLITLDLHLPKVSGEEILDHIRADQRLSGTRVVIATADTRLGEYLSDQVDMMLIKPIRFSHLRDLATDFRKQIESSVS